MAFEDRPNAAEDVPLSTGPVQPSSHLTSGLKSIFAGQNGVRAGWRLLIFLALLGVPVAVLLVIARASGGGAKQVTNTPFSVGAYEAVIFLIVSVVTWVMAKIEHRIWSEYGLPLRQALRKDFWVGSLLGFLAISGTLLTMFLLHGFRVTGLALRGTAILSSLAGWSIAFVLVGLFEEFAFRGYVQYTLASGMGFWPAAFLVSGVFGLAHLVADPNENVVGSVAAVMFGLVLCLFLRRTGNLWCAVGFHFAYDWGEAFFYGVPNSGIVPYHNLFNSELSGPRWLTGGTVGPEASILTPIAILVVALVFSRYHRENRYQITKPVSSPEISRRASPIPQARLS